MVSVLSFDLGAAALGDGDPVTVVADGQTVYSNGPSLYVANDQRWRAPPESKAGNARPEETTELYKFDTSKPGRPVYAAAGSVKGWLINQYAHVGVERQPAGRHHHRAGLGAETQVLVHCVRAGAEGRHPGRRAACTGLGKGEQIYSVRFAGSVGYVVTFRQTDPLYTLDLSEPARPRVTGELKITGYSAYLHPIDGQRLIGVGQEASDGGPGTGHPGLPVRRVRPGAAGPAGAAPRACRSLGGRVRPARLPLLAAGSPAGAAADRLQRRAWTGRPAGKPATMPTAGAMVLRVGDAAFTELGMISHTGQHEGGMIRRSLVVDGVLWTVSESGLKATSMSTLDTLAWISTT